MTTSAALGGGPLYTIVDVFETTTQDGQGRAVRTRAYKYKVGTYGPFTYVAPVTQVDPGQIRDAIAALATSLLATVGQ